MKPLSGRTSFCARIGSPARNPERDEAPAVSSRPLGLLLRVTKPALTALSGQGCQRRSPGRST